MSKMRYGALCLGICFTASLSAVISEYGTNDWVVEKRVDKVPAFRHGCMEIYEIVLSAREQAALEKIERERHARKVIGGFIKKYKIGARS